MSAFMLALFLAVFVGWRFPVRANDTASMDQLLPAFFGLSILGAFAAMQLASGPSAGLTPFDLDRKLAITQSNCTTLHRGYDVVRPRLFVYHHTFDQVIEVSDGFVNQISGEKFFQRYNDPFPMQLWAQVDGRISTNGTAQHNFQDAPAHARSKGPSVLASLEKRANNMNSMVKCG